MSMNSEINGMVIPKGLTWEEVSTYRPAAKRTSWSRGALTPA